jgi:RHS repeat-associated protein
MRVRRRVFSVLLVLALCVSGWSLPVRAVAAPLARPAGDPSSVTPASPPAVTNPTPVVRAVSSSGPTVFSTSVLIKEDTVWGPSGSPYVLLGGASVLVGASLTLLPGTVVKVAVGQQFYVNGQLLSLGSPDARVTVTSALDDTAGGDSNGDGSASTAARGDWGPLFVTGSGSDLRPATVIDYTDFRFGDRSTAMACQTGMVQVKFGARAVITNSSFTDAGVVGLSIQQGVVANNRFARSACGMADFNGSADVIGNTFEASLGRAIYESYPVGMRFWYNTAYSPVIVNGWPAPTRAQADVRYNSLFGGVDHWWPSSQDLSDWSGNWFGRDFRTDAGSCLSSAQASALIPSPTLTYDSTCPSGTQRVSYRASIQPAMTAVPGQIPQGLIDAAAPRLGPVNLVTGSLSYGADDLAFEDAGMSLGWSRSYRSDLAVASSDQGSGWSSSYREAVSTQSNGSAILSLADGTTLPFPKDDWAGRVGTPGVAASVSADAGGTSVRTPDRTTYSFNAAGELTQLVRGDSGNTVVVSRSQGLVSGVTGVSGRSLSVTRGQGQVVNRVTDSAGRQVSYSYDGSRLVSAVGVDGVAEIYAYDADGRLVKVTSGSGVVRLQAGYDALGRVSWFEAAGSGRVEVSYDPAQHSTTATLADGSMIVYRTDALGRVISEQRGSSVTRTVYDGEGRPAAVVRGVPMEAMAGFSALATVQMTDRRGDVVEQISPTGRWMRTAYNDDHQPLLTTTPGQSSQTSVVSREYSAGRMTKLTDGRGGVWLFAYNSRGQVVSQTDPLGQVSSVDYASNGDVAAVTAPTGGVTTLLADALGRMTAQTDPTGATQSVAYTSWGGVATKTGATGGVTSTTYSPDRQPVSRTVQLTASSSVSESLEYDAQGRLTASVDAAGGRSVVGYDSVGQKTTVTDALGAVTSLSYGPQGWLVSSTAPGGAVTRIEYDPAGRAVRQTDPLGRVTQVVLDRDGNVLAEQRPDGTSVKTSYNSAGSQDTMTMPMGWVWAMTYDAEGRLLSTKNPLGQTVAASYDALGRQVSGTDAKGVVTTTTYADAGRTVTTADPLGTLSVTYRDLDGRVTSSVDQWGAQTGQAWTPDGLPSSSTTPAGTTSYTYDLAGRRVTTTDPVGRTTTSSYDAAGRLTASTLAGATTSYAYDALGRTTSTTDPTGNTTAFGYDVLGLVSSVTSPLGGVTSSEHDAAGQLVKRTSPAGVITQVANDPMGREAVAWNVLGASWVTTYDANGNISSQKDPAGLTYAYTYDKADRILTQTQGGTTRASVTYDANGNLVTAATPDAHTYTYDSRNRVTGVKDGLNRLTQYGYAAGAGGSHSETTTTPSGAVWTTTLDAAGRVTTSTDPLLNTAQYQWWPDSQLKQITLPRGGTWQYTYTDRGQLASEQDPDGVTTGYAWDASGRLTSLSRASGRVETSTWDGDNNLATWSATGPSLAPVTRSYSYNPDGQLTAAASTTAGSTTSLTRQYNSRGLLSQETGAVGATTVDYDIASRVSAITGTSGQTVSYGYNTRGQVSSLRGAVSVDMTWRIDGKSLTRTGTSSESWAYDAAGQLATQSTPVGTFTNTYTADGQLATAVQGNVETTGYTYDVAGRLTGSTTTAPGGAITSSQTSTWDQDGNRVSRTVAGQTTDQTVDLAGRVTSASDTTYSYDPDGRLTGQHDAGYTYNAFGELATASVPGQSVAYTRDAFGRLAARTTSAGTDTLGYLGDSPLLSSYKSASASPVDVLRDPNGQVLATLTSSGWSRTATNAHGDLIYAKNATTGTSSTATYDPFGSQRTLTGAMPAPLGYQSGYTDPVTGLVDMGSRSYLPALGVFTQPDTVIGALGNSNTLNRYSYGFSDPVNHTDPTGRWGIDLAKAVGWAIGTAIDTIAGPALAPTVRQFVGSQLKAAGDWIGNAHDHYTAMGSESAKNPVASAANFTGGFVAQGAKDVASIAQLAMGPLAPDLAGGVDSLAGLMLDTSSASYKAGEDTTEIVMVAAIVVDGVGAVKAAPKIIGQVAKAASKAKGTAKELVASIKTFMKDAKPRSREPVGVGAAAEDGSAAVGVSAGSTATDAGKQGVPTSETPVSPHQPHADGGGSKTPATDPAPTGGKAPGPNTGQAANTWSGFVRSVLRDERGSMQLPSKSPWGWSGSRSYRAAVSAVDEGGTLRGVSGIVPSRSQGVQLIEDARGRVLRIEGPHEPPNPHQFPHINYSTSGGSRGTLEILGLDE